MPAEVVGNRRWFTGVSATVTPQTLAAVPVTSYSQMSSAWQRAPAAGLITPSPLMPARASTGTLAKTRSPSR